MPDQNKVRSQTMKLVMVVMPDEIVFDTIYEELEHYLPANVELRYAYFWRDLEEEARAKHQDVVVYFPKDDESARSIRQSMTEIYLCCPEACGILVSATDMSAHRDPFHTEVQLPKATVKTLATKIKELLDKPPVPA